MAKGPSGEGTILRDRRERGKEERRGNNRFQERVGIQSWDAAIGCPLTPSKLGPQSGAPKPVLPQPSPPRLSFTPQTPVIPGSSSLHPHFLLAQTPKTTCA